MAENLSNGFTTTLNGAINNSQTTATLTSASGCPATPFRLAISDDGGVTVSEFVLVTAASGTSITAMTRAVEPIADGTQTAISHLSGATVTQVITRAGLQDLGLSTNTIGVVVYPGSNTAAGTGSYARLDIFNTELFDTDGFHSTSSNNGRITIPNGLSGKYLVYLHTYNSGANGQFTAIYKNGSVQGYSGPMTSADTMSHTMLILDAVAGDYFEAFYGGNSTTWIAVGTWFGAIKLDSGRTGAGIGARVYKASGNQTAPNGSGLALLFDTEVYDTDDFHSTVTNTSRFTIPTGLGGTYIFGGGFYSDGNCDAALQINGTTLIAFGRAAVGDSSIVSYVVDTMYKLVAGDYVELVAIGRGATKTVYTDQSAASPHFWIAKVDSGAANYTGSQWGSGTAFPTGPSTNQRFTRTDRGLDYYYDGTRWLTLAQYTTNVAISPTTSISSAATYFMPIDQTYSTYIEKVDALFYSSGLSSGAYWVLTLNKETAPEVSTSLGSCNIQSGTNSNWLPRLITVNAVVDPATYALLNFSLTKTGSPGATYSSVLITYRLVG